MRAIPTVLKALFLLFASGGLASPAKRNKRLDDRIHARLAAERLKKETGHSAVSVQAPGSSQWILDQATLRTSDEQQKEAKSVGPTRLIVKIGGKTVKKDLAHITSPSYSESLTSSDRTGTPSSEVNSSYGDNVTPSSSDKQVAQRKIKTKQSSSQNDQRGQTPTTLSMPKTRFIHDPRLPASEQNRNYFETVWKEQNLGFHMPAHALADSIKMMSAAGMSSQAAKMFTTRKFRQAKPPQDYEDAYRHRGRKWSVAVNNAKRLLMDRDADFVNLDDQAKREKMYHVASKTMEKNKYENYQTRLEEGLSKKWPLYGKKKQVYEKRQALVQDIGKAFESRLASKKMDFHSMPIEEMEVQARNNRHPGVAPALYPKLLVEYISQHRSKTELVRYRTERIKHNTANTKDRKGS